ncbi:MAG: glycosyl hydrolase 108 family protein [Alphaproteobacteria bacterium]
MIKKIVCFLTILFAPFVAHAADTYSVDELLQRNPDNTKCATAVFADALRATVDTLKNTGTPDEQAPQDADGSEIDTWIHLAFSMPATLNKILECPEVKNAADNDTIVFETVSYTFPNGRTIDINYETQKSVLKQKLLLATKPKLATDDISPNIVADAEKGTVWVNVDPAWYAILVTEHGALSDYVGPDKTNIVALRYLTDNIKSLYPSNRRCTSRSAIAGDGDMINRAVTRTVGGGLPRDENQTDAEREQADIAESNDYYVYGDADLRWITALEVAADVVLTVVTFGGYEIVNGTLKFARATRAFNKSRTALKTLRTSNDVMRWIKSSARADDVARAIKYAERADDAYSTIAGINRTAQQTLKQTSRKLELLRARNADKKTIRAVESELESVKKQAAAAERAAATAEKIKSAENMLKNGKPLSASKQKRIQELEQQIKKLETEITSRPHKSGEAAKLQSQLKTARQEQNTIRNQAKLSADEAKQVEQEIATLKNTYITELTELQKTHASELTALEKLDDVKDYRDLLNAKRELAHTAYLLRQGKVAWRANRGLLPVRAYRAARATRAGLKSAKNMDRAVKTVRANTSGVAAKVNDWLFHSTMKNITAISKVPAAISGLNIAVKVVGDMYDVTDVSTGDYTNNIDIEPFLLLAADNLPGFENIVNHGMWLFWAGSSTSANDDDAAFLQAMSFAEKFHQDLVDVQDEAGIAACDVDIYVVRPIIRNPGTDNQELYYLFMNDVPWTTNGYNETTNTEQQSSTAQTEINGDMAFQENIDATGGISGASKNLKWTEPPYDGSRIGMACTKPSSSGGTFKSDILTTGRYASVSPAFEKAMITKFRTEGGCGAHPEDPGGYTCFGVSSRFFPAAKRPGFSRANAEDIAYNSFWKKHNIDKLPDAISGDVFMALWGTGSKKNSIGLLQDLLGVEKTGIVDNATITAAKNYTGSDLRTRFLDRREAQFRQGNKTFRRGWLNGLNLYRANGCHTIAE